MALAQAQLIIIATPVDTIAERVIQAAAVCPATSLITDAGSTKEAIVAAVDAGLAGAAQRAAICRQPSAGGRSSHGTRACAGRFVRRPDGCGDADRIHSTGGGDRGQSGSGRAWVRMCSRWRRRKHDAALALTSHVPHLAAVAMAAATPSEFLHLTASGWRDTTRVAGGDPNLWQAILTANRQHVLDGARHAGPDRGQSCANLWNKAITRVCFRFWKRRQKRNGTAMLWEIDIHPAEGQPDRAGERVASAAHELGIADGLACRGSAGISGSGGIAASAPMSSDWLASCWRIMSSSAR